MKFIHKNRHFLMMTAGCVAMLVAAFALTSTTSGGSWGFYLLLLLCPAMHILMHRGMHSPKKTQLNTPGPVAVIRKRGGRRANQTTRINALLQARCSYG
jgi:hypothetical protein